MILLIIIIAYVDAGGNEVVTTVARSSCLAGYFESATIFDDQYYNYRLDQHETVFYRKELGIYSFYADSAVTFVKGKYLAKNASSGFGQSVTTCAYNIVGPGDYDTYELVDQKHGQYCPSWNYGKPQYQATTVSPNAKIGKTTFTDSMMAYKESSDIVAVLYADIGNSSPAPSADTAYYTPITMVKSAYPSSIDFTSDDDILITVSSDKQSIQQERYSEMTETEDNLIQPPS